MTDPGLYFFSVEYNCMQYINFHNNINFANSVKFINFMGLSPKNFISYIELSLTN